MYEYYKVCDRECREKELMKDLERFKWSFGQGFHFKTFNDAYAESRRWGGVVILVKEKTLDGQFDPYTDYTKENE